MTGHVVVSFYFDDNATIISLIRAGFWRAPHERVNLAERACTGDAMSGHQRAQGLDSRQLVAQLAVLVAEHSEVCSPHHRQS